MSSVVGVASKKRSASSAPRSNTPSRWMMWKCRLRLRAEPNLWMEVTDPAFPPFRPVACRYHRPIARSETRSTPSARSERRARSHRRRQGTVSTHCRVATCGITRSTRCAARSAIRRPAHDGQKPNPADGSPHPRYAENSRSTCRGSTRSCSANARTNSGNPSRTIARSCASPSPRSSTVTATVCTPCTSCAREDPAFSRHRRARLPSPGTDGRQPGRVKALEPAAPTDDGRRHPRKPDRSARSG
jgi:hypothetical protein